MRLEGKVALITGGARGMGAVEAKMFAQEGAKVAIADVKEEEGRKVEAEITEAGGEAMFVRLDVTQEDDWREAIDRVVARFGKLNVLVNNAGLSGRSYPDISSVDGWDRIMEVNAKGVFLGTKYAVPKLQEAGGGSIVNISSIAGLVGTTTGHPAYNSSKAAVRILTKATAVRYGVDGIRANSVHPGRMPPTEQGVPTNDAELQTRLTQTPLRRVGQREEVAYAVLFLASDEASYITGVELPVDGGFTAG